MDEIQNGPSYDQSDRRLFQRIGLVAIFIALLNAALALFGWVTGWQILTSLHPAFIPIAPSTALAFVLLLIILLAIINGSLRGKWIWAASLGVLMTTIFGLLEVLQYYTGLNLDLEDVLLPNLGLFDNSIPAGRMSPGSGALFVLAGLGILALLAPSSRSNPRHPARDFAGLAAILLGACGLTFLIAYLLGQPLMYNIQGLIPISVMASFGFLCLGVAIAAAAGPQSFPGDWFSGTSTRARMLRALAPLIVLIGLFNFIADPLAHFLASGNIALATAIMSVSYMLATAVVFGLAARGVGLTIDRAEAERKQATDELRALFAAMDDVVLVYDREGRYLQIAPTNPSRLARSAAEMLGKTVDQVLPAEQARLVLETIRRALAEGRTVHITYALTIAGVETWFEGSVSPLTEKTVFFVARDVTASHQAEQALRESEARFRSITEQLTDLIALTDANGIITYASPASRHVFGAAPEQMTGRHFTDFLDESAIPAAQAAFEDVLRDNRSAVHVEMLMKRLDGSTFSGELNSSMVHSSIHPGSLVTIRDISERKRSEEGLTRLAAIVGSTEDAVFSWTLDGVITSWNPGAERLFGYSASQAVGQPVSIIQPPERQSDWENIRPAIERGEHISHFETTRLTRDGRLVDVSLSISLIKSSANEYTAGSTIARDITERIQAEAEIRQLNRDLEKRVEERTAELQLANLELARAARMKDEFLASMSHELRTPLTGILGLSESLQMNTYGDLSEKHLKLLKLIHDSGQHLLELINDILDLSKIEAGKFDLQMEACSLGGLCQASLQMTRGMVQKKRQLTNFAMEPAEITLRADARRVKQMLVNLLSNAAKFTPEGGSLGIDILGSRAEQKVRITVWDTGIGISPEDLPRLFQVFVQLDSKLSRQYPGTGLGLALVKRLAELHGGSVEVESAPGQGSRFTISLPWEAETPAPAARLSMPAGRLQQSLSFEEDDVPAEMLTVYLKNLGIHNRNMPVALGAVELAAEFAPDVILAHLGLPDKPGLQLLAEFKADARTHGIPVLLMSVDDKRGEALAAGAAGFLLKPFSQADVQSELARITPRTPLLAAAPKSAPVVLMADDDRIVLEAVSDYLRSRGLQVVTALSGIELLEGVERIHPDVLLIDIQMPGITGLEVMRRIRAHPDAYVSRLPMIALTALAMSGDRERCLEAGANEYLSKPVQLAQLLETIRALCP